MRRVPGIRSLFRGIGVNRSATGIPANGRDKHVDAAPPRPISPHRLHSFVNSLLLESLFLRQQVLERIICISAKFHDLTSI